LKENWLATYAEVERVFTDLRPDLVVERCETIDGDHGCIETRRHTICHSIEWLFSDRRYPGEFQFPCLTAVGMIESQTERGNVIEKERRYYLCSGKLDAGTFARVVRGHWGLENRLHRILDVVFRGDLARLRSGHGPTNLAIVKHVAMNPLTLAKPTTSLKNRRKRAGWNQDHLEVDGKTVRAGRVPNKAPITWSPPLPPASAS
jgi:predicted transposase YbfD/YdcC